MLNHRVWDLRSPDFQVVPIHFSRHVKSCLVRNSNMLKIIVALVKSVQNFICKRSTLGTIVRLQGLDDLYLVCVELQSSMQNLDDGTLQHSKFC